MDDVTKGLGYINLGHSYANSANYLAAHSNEPGNSFSHPINFLYTHAFELMLKGCLLKIDPQRNVKEEFGHNLLKLYDAVKKENPIDNLIENVETAIRKRWKQRLSDARDKWKSRISSEGTFSALDTDGRNELFGICNNQEIGNSLNGLSLRKQVQWLSNRNNAKDGSEFRYLKIGPDQKLFFEAFDLNDDVVWKSSEWACAEIYQNFINHYKG